MEAVVGIEAAAEAVRLGFRSAGIEKKPSARAAVGERLSELPPLVV